MVVVVGRACVVMVVVWGVVIGSCCALAPLRLSAGLTVLPPSSVQTYEGHQNFTFEDRFVQLDVLGEGSFNVVHQAREKVTGIVYAVKRSKRMLQSKHERCVPALLPAYPLLIVDTGCRPRVTQQAVAVAVAVAVVLSSPHGSRLGCLQGLIPRRVSSVPKDRPTSERRDVLQGVAARGLVNV